MAFTPVLDVRHGHVTRTSQQPMNTTELGHFAPEAFKSRRETCHVLVPSAGAKINLETPFVPERNLGYFK